MRRLMARRWLTFFAIGLLACVLALPQLVAPAIVPHFQGMSPMEADNEMHYFARIVSARYGGFVGNPFLAGERKDVLPFPLSPEVMMAIPMNFFPLSIHAWNLCYRLVAGAALAGALYLFVWELLRDRWFAMAGTALVLIGSSAVIESRGIVAFFLGHSQSIGFLHYARYINPLVSGVFFFLFCLFLFRFLKAEKHRVLSTIILGVILGSLLYTYLYFWFFAVTAFMCLGMYLFITRFQAVRHWLCAGLVAVFIDLPYVISYFLSQNDPAYRTALGRNSLIMSHEPNIGVMVLIYSVVWLVAIVCMRKRLSKPDGEARYFKMKAPWILHSIFLASSWVVLNQQVVTGRVLQPGHFYWYIVVPCFLLLIVTIVHELSSRFTKRFQTGAAFLLFAATLAVGIAVQSAAFAATKPVVADRQEAAGALGWLMHNGQSGEVVFTDQELSNAVPVYTNKKVFYANSVVMYPVSPDRIRLGHYLWWFSQGLSLDDVTRRITSTPEFIQTMFESHYFRWLKEEEPERYAAEVKAITEGYAGFLQKDVFATLDDYAVRYVCIDTKTDDFRTIISETDRQVYADARYRIYERRR